MDDDSTEDEVNRETDNRFDSQKKTKKENITMTKLEQTIALLEKVTGRKVNLVEAKKEPNADALHKAKDKKDKSEKEAKEATADKLHKQKEKADAKKETKKESVMAESKDEKETPKDKKVDKAIKVAADVAPANIEKTAAGIIPPAAIQTIQTFMDETLMDIQEGVTELQSYRIDGNTVVSGEDFYEKAEELQDSIKQIARMNTFVKNTIIAKKFDANLLDMIVSYKHSHPTPAVSSTPAMDMGAPMI